MTLLELHYSHNGAALYVLAGAIVALNTTYEGSGSNRKSSGCQIGLSTGHNYLVKETAEEIFTKLIACNYPVHIARFK